MHSKASICKPHQHCGAAQLNLKYDAQHQNICLILKGTPLTKTLGTWIAVSFNYALPLWGVIARVAPVKDRGQSSYACHHI